MKKPVLKKIAAIICLVLVCIFSINAIEFKKQENLTEKKRSASQDTIIPRNSETPVKTDIQRVYFDGKDWAKAPNSYLFDPKQNSEGLYIPVRKAYVMWKYDQFLGGVGVPLGNVTADVLWEDNPGLIKSGSGYLLEITGTGENAKIKVPINKSKEGNAVIALKINNEIFWSWHVWVTDNPENGSTYKSFPGVSRQKSDGTVEMIPDSEWRWMDRNLGAVGSSITGTEWNKNGGLLYQWGRKDPIPPLVLRGDDFYEVSGSLGRVRHRGAKNFTGAIKIDDLRKFVLLSNAEVNNNIKLSIKNPLSLIYVYKNDNSGPAYYNNNAALMVNWFGRSTTLPDSRLSELNLWSDNSQGKIGVNYNLDNNARPYRDKSAYDPCPNGWRIPSMLVANLSSQAYVDDIRIDFSPFGVRTNMGKSTFENNKYHVIKPTDANTPAYMQGFKLYANTGFDLSNVGGFNMGIFPGTGQVGLTVHQGQYTDQHHSALWTATMMKHFDSSPTVGARALFMVPDKGQPDVPDAALPTVKGRYWYMPLAGGETSGANGCRCIKDPLYLVNNYDFPTEYLEPAAEFREGLNNPNTYQIVKSATAATLEIPVSKAFSVQSEILNNKEILNPANFNNLKVNVLWTTNPELINNVTIPGGSPGSLSGIPTAKIAVAISPNQSGNAVITLHNGNITNPVYWSWHVWVTDTPIGSISYVTEVPNTGVTNYVNYVEKGASPLKTDFMDRNLGSTEAFPAVANPLTPTADELSKIRNAAGLQYQWGRKDPIPSLQYADGTSYNIFLGNTADNGSVTYTTLTPAAYNNLQGSYMVPFNTYTNAANANVTASDKIADKIAKVLLFSVRNPLAYMIPSALAAYNSSAPLYTNGTDWLANEPNLAPDRWGRGTEKSPFDPCPEGWRIPDLTGVSITSYQDFGITPWYKKDKNVATSYTVASDYLGTRVRNSANTTLGYMFTNPAYPVGNYPNSGSRGFRSVTANQTAVGTYNTINFLYPGIWTGALLSNYIGRPINLLFDAASTNNRMIAFHDNNDPYFGMSCRCVKMKFDANGEELGPIPKDQITSLPALKPSNNSSNNKVIETKDKDSRIILVPNPVKDILYIKGTEDKTYRYQIYSVSGQRVQAGKFEDGKINVSGLVSGEYMVIINNSEAVIKIIKH
ncbi:T9SS type A sorting domain-containing protein [Chryseobacterium culicis]|uniref:T9SS type A sorting domain-containing protein n=1 Tax=Chryseobacterium culicis TaxID=680127 RepID=UPI001876E4F0|nr:T9SS type A sorting domain-containing protein [Chryseobacterium culicis]MBE4951254.1 T9SS type A sorting domain-containing protein [Chryseobacterium culicis]